MNAFTHIDEKGAARMVDVGAKDETERSATARSFISMQLETLRMINDDLHKKGDVLGVARIAGIQAAKRCSDLIPLCHPLMLTSVSVDLQPSKKFTGIEIIATAKLCGKTGVEMEALTAASIAALTIYDMCKAVDKGMVIKEVKLIEKKGGKSGHWQTQDTHAD